MKKLGKKKLALAFPVLLLLVAGVGYKMYLAPKPKPVKLKVPGTLVALTDPFTLNLAAGHYGRVSVALLLSQAPPAAATDASTGAVVLPENDAVRSVITNDLTGIDPQRLINRGARAALLAELLADLKKSTDEPVTRVMFTDIAVQ